LFQTIWITAFNFGRQARTNFAQDFSGKLLRKHNYSRFLKLWVYKRWCAHDTRDFLKEDLVWKDKKTNSCVTIENSPTFYGGQPLLSTDSCKKSLPFICEVLKITLHIILVPNSNFSKTGSSWWRSWQGCCSRVQSGLWFVKK